MAIYARKPGSNKKVFIAGLGKPGSAGSGEGESIENVITLEGGGTVILRGDFGGPPYQIEIDAEPDGESGGSGSGGDVDLSAYAPKANPVFTGSISLGRKSGSTVGQCSLAAGADCEASGLCSHAEGINTVASGRDGCHAEGKDGIASGISSHVEGGRADGGNPSEARGHGSHAEGVSTRAIGPVSHAEGSDTEASGSWSHAEGVWSVASGSVSHASGRSTIASAFGQFVVGCLNVEYAGPTGIHSVNEDAIFIVGKGVVTSTSNVRANAFRVGYSGTYASGNYNASGADYAELFEWADGNPDGEDRRGRFVTLKGEKIRLAGPDDAYILGIVSGNPSVIGDVYDDQWQGMYLYDIFGAPIWEDAEAPAETDSGGNIIMPARMEHRQKLNPDYDPTQTYTPRTERPEWDAVGLVGKLVMVDDGSCIPDGYCTAGEGGIAVASGEQTRFRVMSRLDESHIRVMIL